MDSKIELDTQRANVYTDANLSRILGILEAYVKGKKVTLNWVYNQIAKGHDISDARRILELFENDLNTIDSQRFIEIKERFS